MNCPPSQGDGLRIDGDNQMARMGTAVHDSQARYILAGEMIGAEALGSIHGVDDTDEMGPLLWKGRKAWDEISSAFPNPMVERAMEMDLGDGHKLTGHVDVMSYVEEEDELRVLDWKTGRKQRDFLAQLMAYSLLAIAGRGGVMPKAITCTVVWLRDGALETVRIMPEQLTAFLSDLTSAVRMVEGKGYRVGDYCENCPRHHDCPARTALVRSSIREIADIDANTILALGDRLPMVYAGVKCAEGACKAFRDALRELASKGPVTAGGKVYELNEIQKRIVDPLTAWPVLSGHLTEAELAPAVKISLTALMDAVAAKAPARGKGRAKIALTEQLEAAGAIKTKAESRLSERTA